MGADSNQNDFARIDLSEVEMHNLNIHSEAQLEDYLHLIRHQTQSRFLYGGYLEKRGFYKSTLFKHEKLESRDIHLGIDIWAPVKTPIYAPLRGKIHSWAFNNNPLDYGYTLIIEHEARGRTFYSLYGHLSKEFSQEWVKGRMVAEGDLIATLGDKTENGGWLPHLHFQTIIDLEGNSGDYPGVCSENEVDYYRENCPDPRFMISTKKRLNHDD